MSNDSSNSARNANKNRRKMAVFGESSSSAAGFFFSFPCRPIQFCEYIKKLDHQICVIKIMAKNSGFRRYRLFSRRLFSVFRVDTFNHENLKKNRSLSSKMRLLLRYQFFSSKVAYSPLSPLMCGMCPTSYLYKVEQLF